LLALYQASFGRGRPAIRTYASGEGEAMKWACSPRYLGDLLAVVGEKVTVQLSSPTTQGVFRNDEDFVHVVMPMRLNGFSQ